MYLDGASQQRPLLQQYNFIQKDKDEVLYRNVSKCICFYIDVVFLFVAPLEPNIIVGVAL